MKLKLAWLKKLALNWKPLSLMTIIITVFKKCKKRRFKFQCPVMIEFEPFTLKAYLPWCIQYAAYIFRYFSKSFQDVEIQTEAYQEMTKKYILPSIIHSERPTTGVGICRTHCQWQPWQWAIGSGVSGETHPNSKNMASGEFRSGCAEVGSGVQVNSAEVGSGTSGCQVGTHDNL